MRKHKWRVTLKPPARGLRFFFLQIIVVKMSLQARAQVATTEYQKLQADLQNAVEARQRLDSQLQENEMVKIVSS
jgi:hypothetical protein